MLLPLLLATSLAASPMVLSGIPPPVGLEKVLVDQAKGGRLKGMDLLEAALVASGVQDGQVKAEAQRVREALAPAIARAKTQRDAPGRGRALLRALHETVFRKYVRTATEVDRVVRTGEFNCLSSALLYVVAADGLLESPRGMLTPRHAFARVTVENRSVDIETTTPEGFGLDRRALTPEQVEAIAGPGITPAEFLESLEQLEELPQLTWVAGVYLNRAVGLAERGERAAAAVAIDRASRLASGKLQQRWAEWRSSLLNDGANEMAKQHRFDDARALLEFALEGARGPLRETLTTNLATVRLQMASAAFDRGDWAAALSHAEVAERLGNDEATLEQLKAEATARLAALEGSDERCQAKAAAAGTPAARAAGSCLAALALTLVDEDPAKALQYAKRAQALAPGELKGSQGMLFAIDRLARDETDKGNCEGVEALVLEGLASRTALPGQKWQPEQIMGQCWALAAQAAFEREYWDDAARLYSRARAHLGADPALVHNLALVDTHRGIELAKVGRCDDARPLLRRASEAETGFAETGTSALALCAGRRGAKAFEAKDFATAALEVRKGLQDAPDDPTLKSNLGVALHNLAATFLNQTRCDEARALVPELESLQDGQTAAVVKQRCP